MFIVDSFGQSAFWLHYHCSCACVDSDTDINHIIGACFYGVWHHSFFHPSHINQDADGNFDPHFFEPVGCCDIDLNVGIGCIQMDTRARYNFVSSCFIIPPLLHVTCSSVIVKIFSQYALIEYEPARRLLGNPSLEICFLRLPGSASHIRAYIHLIALKWIIFHMRLYITPFFLVNGPTYWVRHGVPCFAWVGRTTVMKKG
jgi:hypothetical protein